MSGLDGLLLRTILDTVGEGIVAVDSNSTIVMLNREAQRTWGYEEGELIGQHLDILIPEKYRVVYAAALQRYLETGITDILGQRIECEGVKKDGTIFPLEVRIEETKVGERLLFTMAIRDLTEHKRTERLLATQYSVNRRLAEAVNLDDAAHGILQAIGEGLEWELGALWCVDRQTNVLRCVETWHAPSIVADEFEAVSRQTSFQPGVELPGDVWAGGEPIWIANVLKESTARRLEDVTKQDLHTAFCFPIRHSSGVLGVIEFFGRQIPPPDGALLAMIVLIGHQIGQFMERSRTEIELREREEQFRQLAEHIHEIFWIVDTTSCQVLYVSPAYEAVWDRSCKSLYEQPTSFLDAIYPDDRERIGATLGRWIAGEYDEVYRIVRPNGEICWIWTRSFPIRNENGDIYRTVGIAEDITERKQSEERLRQSAERLKHLYELDKAILTAYTPHGIAESALQQIRQIVPCDRATLMLFDLKTREATVLAVHFNGKVTMLPGERFTLEEVKRLEELRQGKVQLIEDISTLVDLTSTMQSLQSQGLRSYISVPLISEGELIGTLSLAANTARAFTPEHVNIVREMAVHLAVTVQHAWLFEEVQAGRERLEISARQLLEAQENERRHIARELHDEIGQALTAVKMNLQVVQRLPDASCLMPQLEESIGIIEHVLQQVRELSLDLRPSMLDDLGLVSALRWYVERLAQRAGLVVHVTVEPLEIRLPAELETACFRVAQEALTNVVRYAHARSLNIELRSYNRELHLSIRDDGIGFDMQAVQERAAHGRSFGLLGMQERVELVGGHIVIKSKPMHGTEIRASFPLTGQLSADPLGGERGAP